MHTEHDLLISRAILTVAQVTVIRHYRFRLAEHAAAAAAAKSLPSCPTLCDPIDDSPLGSSVPGSGLPFPSPMHESEK